MNCQQIQNILIEIIEGSATIDQNKMVVDHLKSCNECQEEYSRIKQIMNEIAQTPEEQPNSTLRMDFYHMLEQEKQFNNNQNSTISIKSAKNFLNYAAAILLIFGAGLLLGKNIQWRTEYDARFDSLNKQAMLIRQNVSMASLMQPTTSQRLQAVNILHEQAEEDNKIIDVLIQTLNYDENVNVRMAAANALAKYPENKSVRDALIRALDNQKEPALQIKLINILMKAQDQRAKRLFHEIIQSKETLPVVKQQAKNGLKVFT